METTTMIGALIDVNDEKKMDGHFLLIGLDTYM